MVSEMREGIFNRVERAERVEKGLGVSSQELESGEVIAHAKSAKFAKSDVGNVLIQRHKGTGSWPMVRLGDVCETLTDGDWIESKDQSYEGIRLIQTGNVGDGRFLKKENRARYISLDTFQRLKCTEIFPGDVLVSRLPEPVGRACIVEDIGLRMITAVDCSIIRFTKDVYAKYFVMFSQSPKYQESISFLVTGTTRARISRKNLSSIQIPLPPIKMQEEIVERLEKELGEADKVAAEFKRIAELADEEFKAELDEMFGGLGNGELGTGSGNDSNRVERAEHVEKGLGVSSQELVLAAKNAKVAEDWPMVRLGDVCEVARGGSPRPIKQYITDDLNGLNWIKIGDVDAGGKYIEKTSEKIKLSGLCKTRKVNAGEFLLSNSMSFGRPYILKIDGCIHDGWLVLRGFESVLEENFFYYLLRSRLVQEQFELYAHGSTVRNLNTKSVEEVQISLPSISVQKEIVAKLDAAKERCEKLKAEAERGLRASENLRKAILSEVFE